MFHHQKFPKNAVCKNALLNSTSFSPLSYWRKLLNVSEQLSASKRPKKHKLKAEVSITPLLAALLAACSNENVPVRGTLDGTNVTTPTGNIPPQSFNLYVLDGAIEGARVYVDENNTGEIADNQTPIGTTGENGYVFIDAEYAGETFLIDASDAFDLFAAVRLPSDTFYRAISEDRGGSDVVASPISTIVQALRENDPAPTDTDILELIFGANTQVDMDDLNNPNNYILPIDDGDKPTGSPGAIAEQIASTSIQLQVLIEQEGGDLTAVLAAIGESFDISDLNPTSQGIAAARIIEARERGNGEPVSNVFTPASLGLTLAEDGELSLNVEVWGFRDPVGNVNDDNTPPSSFTRLNIASITDGSTTDVRGVLVHIVDDGIETEYGAGDPIPFEHLGNLFFRPATDYSGDVQIIYTVFDGEDVSDEVSLEIEVIFDPNAPVFTSGDTPPNVNENIDANDNNDNIRGNAVMVYEAEIETNPLHGTSLSYSLLATDDGDSFRINASGEVWFRVSPDHEDKPSYSFTVVASVMVDDVPLTTDLIVTLDLNDLNDTAPDFTSLATASVNENIAASDSDGDIGSAAMAYEAQATPDGAGDDTTVRYSLADDDTTTFGIDAGSGDVWFKASPNFESQSAYTFTVIASVTVGGEDRSREQEVMLTINDVNEAPTADDGHDSYVMMGAVIEDAVDATDTGEFIATDEDAGDTLGYSIETQGEYGTLTLTTSDGADGKWSYVLDNSNTEVQALAENETMEDRITLRATDSDSAYVERDVTITITGVNEAPTADDGHDSYVITGAVIEDAVDATDTGEFIATDEDGDTLTYSIETQGEYGTLTLTTSEGADGKWSYVLDNSNTEVQALAENETMEDRITLRATDSDSAYVERDVTITITGVNDAPVLAADDDDYVITGAVTEDAVDATDTGEFIATDAEDGDTLTYSIVGLQDNIEDASGRYGTLTLDTTDPITGDKTDGKWSYALDNSNVTVNDLNDNATLEDKITLRATDSEGASVDQEITITITGADDALTVSSNSTHTGAVTEDATTNTATGEFIATGSSMVTYEFSPQEDGRGTYGTLTLTNANDNTDGNWTYTLDNTNTAVQALAGGASETDTFTLRATSAVSSVTQVVTITITGANDAPTLNFPNSSLSDTITEDTPGENTASGRFRATDVDGEDTNLRYSVVTQGEYSAMDTVVGATNGVWTYVLDNTHTEVQALAGNATLTDTITLQVTDGTDTFNRDVIITINGRTDVNGTSGNDGSSSSYIGSSSSMVPQIVQGGDGADYLQGGTRDDILIGGRGADFISLSHQGVDTVVYRIASTGSGLVGSDGNDTIQNFDFTSINTSTGVQDKIVFVDTDSTPLGSFADLLDLGKNNSVALAVRVTRDSTGVDGITFQFNDDDDGILTVEFRTPLSATSATAIFGANGIDANDRLTDTGLTSFLNRYDNFFDVIPSSELGFDII